MERRIFSYPCQESNSRFSSHTVLSIPAELSGLRFGLFCDSKYTHFEDFGKKRFSVFSLT
jgi:hypothetical protein